MEKITFENLPSTNTPINANNLNQVQTNVENAINDVENVELLAVSSVAPSECSEGDKYFNTNTKLIYEATDTDTWSSTGTPPISDIFYIVLSEQKIYTYNGTTLISVGGGAGGGGETLPVGSEIDFDGETTDIPTGWEQVTNPDSYSTDEIKTNKVWIDGKPIYRKIFEGTANIQQSGSSQPIADFPSDSETIINLYGCFKWSSYLQTFPIVWGTSSCSLRVVGKSIQYFSNFGIGSGTYIIISEYTKTTD